VSAELAQHWAAAGHAPEALVASVTAAREAQAVFGLAEAAQHLERALALWDLVPGAAKLVGLDLAALLAWTAEVADATGAGARAVELMRRAITLVVDDPVRAALLQEGLGRFLVASGGYEAALAAFRSAVDLVPAEPVTAERAHVLAALGNALMLGWRHDESREVCEQALELARQAGARRSEFRALGALGVDLAYLGRAEEGLDHLGAALRLAEDSGEPQDLGRAYILLTDVLTMLGRPRESVQVAAAGIALARRHGGSMAWTSPAPSSSSGSDGGTRPIAPSATGCGACRPRRRRCCGSGSASRACGPRPSWRRWPAPGATATRSPTGSGGPSSSSARPARRRARRRP
jgi:tetratricopeptide (TPR) repeat protein